MNGCLEASRNLRVCAGMDEMATELALLREVRVTAEDYLERGAGEDHVRMMALAAVLDKYHALTCVEPGCCDNPPAEVTP